MNSLLLLSRLLALSAAVLVMTACGESSEETAESDSGAGAHSQGVAGFFQPQKGESWKYKVQKEIPLDVALAPDDEALRPERTDSGHLITFERVRTCAGTKNYKAAGRELTAMDIFENDELLGHELYDIGPEGVFFRGWMGAADEEPRDLLAEGVRLASPDLQAGQRWESTGVDPERQFHFRVIERSTIEVPAGQFEAVRIQITSDHLGKGLKRTIWFAENIGIVKEQSVYYGPQRTRVRETSELVHFTVPTQAPPAEEALVSVPLDQKISSGEEQPAEDGPAEGEHPEQEPDPGDDPSAGEADSEKEEGEENSKTDDEADPSQEEGGKPAG